MRIRMRIRKEKNESVKEIMTSLRGMVGRREAQSR
jgi:hypothetical protein